MFDEVGISILSNICRHEGKPICLITIILLLRKLFISLYFGIYLILYLLSIILLNISIEIIVFCISTGSFITFIVKYIIDHFNKTNKTKQNQYSLVVTYIAYTDYLYKHTYNLAMTLIVTRCCSILLKTHETQVKLWDQSYISVAYTKVQ